ncbi:hypothetical protein FRC11_010286 [Ceratobasidium sp. 423]|nr:hypothetical protein FRC11_010286 [Ceratobasidium sp. 423]
MDGIIQLIGDWLPKDEAAKKILNFSGPIIVNEDFMVEAKGKKPLPLAGTLWNILKERKFGRKKIQEPEAEDDDDDGGDDPAGVQQDLHDDSIPAAMSNQSPGIALWKLIKPSDQGPGGDNGGQPEKVPKPPIIPEGGSKPSTLAVDRSLENPYSIITTWNDGHNPRIVTTGDAIGSQVLHCVNTENSNPLGIFKIPHHGSQYNSQIDYSYDVPARYAKSEGDHYFVLACICWHLLSPQNTSPIPEDKRSHIEKVQTDVLLNCRDEWIGLRSEDPMEPERDETGFFLRMRQTTAAFLRFIQYRKFKFTDPETNKKLPLKDDAHLLTFAVYLSKRLFATLNPLYKGKIEESKDERDTNYLAKKLSPKFNFDQFYDLSSNQTNYFPKVLVPMRQDKHLGGKVQIVDIIEPQIRDIISVLRSDPSAELHFRMGIMAFYQKLRANNYVISANGTHQHPHPNLIASLITTAVERQNGECRLFVTDGAALQVERIIVMVKDMLRGRLGLEEDAVPPVREWSNKIRIYYLDDDYCAPIPTDLSPVSGFRELDLGAWEQARPGLKELHDQFNRTSAYDIPRAAEPRSSHFRLYATNVPGISEHLPLNYLNSHFQFGGASDATSSRFYLSSVVGQDHGSVKRVQYLLGLVYDRPQPSTAGTAGLEVVVKPSSSSSPHTGAEFQLFNSDGTQALHYASDNNGTPNSRRIQMGPIPDGSKLQVVHVQFHRVDGFGTPNAPGPANIASNPIPRAILPEAVSFASSAPELSYVSSVEPVSSFTSAPGFSEPLAESPPSHAPIPELSRTAPPLELATLTHVETSSFRGSTPTPIISRPTDFSLGTFNPEPFGAWWHRVNSTGSSPPVLRDIIQFILEDWHAQCVLSEIRSIPSKFVLANVEHYRVNVKTSPPVRGPDSITCALVLDQIVTFPDFAGLGPANIESLLATVSRTDASLKLDLRLVGPASPSCQFTFVGRSPLEAYLTEIGYSHGLEGLNLATLAASIVGPDAIQVFFRNLPASLASAMSLPTLPVDPKETTISYIRSPFGIEVQTASIAAVLLGPLSSIQIGPLSLLPVSTTLAIEAKGYDTFNTTLKSVVDISFGEKTLQFSFAATSDGVKPVVLDFFARSATAPSDILQVLGLGALSSIKLPLEGGDKDLAFGIETIGFTLVQPYVGSHKQLDLSSVYFSIGASWEPWKKVLPSQISPASSTSSDLSLKVVFLRPRPGSPLSIGLQLDYVMAVDQAHSNLLFRMSHRPIKGLDCSYRTSISFRADTGKGLPPPTISDVLTKFTKQSWRDVTDSIPVLGSSTQAIAVTHGSLEVDGKTVSGFSLGAQIRDLELLSNPSINIDAAELLVDYDGISWSGRFSTIILFAGKFRCAADVVLPKVGTIGGISFRNLSDDFTCGALVEAIDPSIRIETVPVIGSKGLASLRLDRASVDVLRSNDGHSISGFEIALSWGSESIGQLKMSKNRLLIGMYKGSTDSVSSIAGSGTIDTESTWVVHWEGGLFEKWHLSADLHYSTIRSNNTSTRVLMISGVILNPVDRIHSADLVDSWSAPSSSSGSPSSGSLWQRTVPENVTKSFQLQECAVSVAIGGDIETFACSARATWGQKGQGTGLVLIEKCNPPPKTGSKWGFAFVLDVRYFRFTDLVSDSALANQIDEALNIKQVSVLVFRNPGNMGLKRVSELVGNASASNLLPPGSSVLSSKTLADKDTFDRDFKAGVAIFAQLSFGNAKPGSLTHNLDSVANSKLSEVKILGFFGKTDKNESVVSFTASISSLRLLSSVTLNDINLTYAPSSKTAGQPEKIANTLSLSADCLIEFPSDSRWKIHGELVISKEDAKLSAKLTEGSLDLSETLGLQVSNIELTVQYTFSKSTNTPDEDDAGDKPDDSTRNTGGGVTSSTPNTGANQPQPSRIEISLAGKASLGSFEADVSVVFDSHTPGALTVKSPGKLKISDLFRKLFDASIPDDSLDLSFSNFLMYYAWKSMKNSSSEIKLRGDTFTAGFHAEADVNVFGVSFLLSVDIHSGDKDSKGITIAGVKKKPVEVLGLTLHGKAVKTEGPRFKFSTVSEEKGCSVETGLTLFDTDLGSVSLSYNSKDSRFRGNVDIKAQFLPNGHASVTFELANNNGKHVLRFVELPAMFDELLEAIHIIDSIKKLSAGDRCGVLDLVIDQLFKTKVHVKVTVSDSQKGLSPDHGKEGASSLELSVGGSLDIQIASKSIDNIVFDPFPVSVAIPKSFSLDSFGTSLGDTLKNSAEQIVKGLWKNKEKFAEFLAIIGIEKLASKAISSLICRGQYTPETNTSDPPGDEQEPTGEDGGGSEGDGGSGSGSGSGAGGGGSAVAAAIAGAIAGGASLAGSLLKERRSRPKTSVENTPDRPTAPKDPPPTPLPTDKIGQAIHKALSKKFDRWKARETYSEALETALACALEYRDAILLLRKVLRSREVTSKLGNSLYNDYRQRLPVLIYDFSMMGKQFAERWLDMSDYEITMTAHSPTPEGRELDISWSTIHRDRPIDTAVTLLINGEPEPSLNLEHFENTNTTTIHIPPLSRTEKLTITVQVSAVGAAMGGEPKYAFFSIGDPVSATMEEVPPSETKLRFEKEFPSFMVTSDSNSLYAGGEMPVLIFGSHRYWPMRFRDNRMTTGLVAQSVGTLREAKRWERGPTNYIHAIQFGESAALFSGQQGGSVRFDLDELAIPDSKYLRIRVTERNAESQPPLPEDLGNLSYVGSVENTRKYPVLVMGTTTWWPVRYTDSEGALAVLGYDGNLKFRRLITIEPVPSGQIERINVISDPYNPHNQDVELYGTDGRKLTTIDFALFSEISGVE